MGGASDKPRDADDGCLPLPRAAPPAVAARPQNAAALLPLEWQILETLLEGILVIDAQSHVILGVNAAAERLFGAGRSSIVGHECHSFVCPKERGECPISDLGQTVDRSERVLITSEGRQMPVLKTVTQMSRDSRDYLIESIQDLSELRASTETNSRLAALLESMRDVAVSADLEEALTVVARATADTLNCPECIVYEYDAAAGVIIPRAHIAAGPSSWDALGVPLPVSEHPLELAALRNGTPREERRDRRTELIVPLRHEPGSTGLVVLVETERERHFAEDEVALVSGLGEQAAAAIHNAQLLRRLEERNRRLTTLAEAGGAMAAHAAPEKVLADIARHAVEGLQSYCCLLSEYVEETDTIVERAYFCSDPEDAYELKSWALAEDDWGTRAVLAEGAVVERRLSDPALTPSFHDSMASWGEKSVLIVPLHFRDEPMGLLVLTETESERGFDEEERAFAAALGRQAAAVMHGGRQVAALTEQGRRLASMLDVGSAASSSIVLDDVLRTVAHQAAQALHTEQCVIWVYHPESQTVHEHGCYPEDDEEIMEVYTLEDRPDYAQALFAEQPVEETMSDPDLAPTSRASMEEWGEKTCLSVPLRFGGDPLGILILIELQQERHFTKPELDLAMGLADQAAIAIHNAQLYEDLATAGERAALVADSAIELSSTLEVGDVLRSAARRMTSALGVTSCNIFRLTGRDELVCLLGSASGEPNADWTGSTFPLDEWPCSRLAIETGSPVAIESPLDPRLGPIERRQMIAWGEKSLLIIPLIAGDTVAGTAEFSETRQARTFTEEDIATAEAVARIAALALSNAELYGEEAERTHRLASLLRASQAITSSLDYDEVLAEVARSAAEAFGCPECIIFNVDEETQTLAADAVYHEDHVEYKDLHVRLPLDESPSDRLLIAGRRIVVETISDPDLPADVRASMEKWGEKTSLSVPLYVGDEALGVLVLNETKAERVFNSAEFELAAGLGEQAALAMRNARLVKQLRLSTEETALLNDVARAAASSLDPPTIAERAVEQLRGLLDFHEAMLLLRREDGEPLEVVYATEAAGRLAALSRARTLEGLLEGPAVDEVTLMSLPVHWSRRSDGELEALRSTAVVSLHGETEPIGALVLASESADAFSARDESVLRGIGAQLSLAMSNALLYESVRRLHLGNLRVLSSALTAKDYYTIGHTARVAGYATLLAEELGWSDQMIAETEEAAYLHDVGKIAVSDNTLAKSGPLSEEEWTVMRYHPVVSAEIIEPLLDARLVASVRHHHERYDGAGYPDGIDGEQIPELARLLCVVDSYDAMSSRRTYRDALTYEHCVEEVLQARGTQFDPRMADAFLVVLARLRELQGHAQRAAADAAALIDPEKHAMLRGPDDAARPEYAEIQAALRRVLASNPPGMTLVTETQVDELRGAIIVDADDDPQSHAPCGELILNDDAESDTFAGRTRSSTVISVDSWGTWVSGNAPVHDADGRIVALVSASISPLSGRPRGGLSSDVTVTFAELARSAAARVSHAEVDALTDSLTGLYNHRSLQQHLSDEVQTAAAGGTELSLLFCDVDRFKELNDRYGHPYGDDALRRVAHSITATIRHADIAARYGGDEFVIILPGVGEDEALDIGERIRARVEDELTGVDGRRTTISIGVAARSAETPTGEAVLRAADAAMYAAKGGGRNRCEMYSRAGFAALDTTGDAPRGRADAGATAPTDS